METNQYIVLIQNNTKTQPSTEQWLRFFDQAKNSGIFKGGSEIGTRTSVGDTQATLSTEHVVGYMRFDSEEKQMILDLLQSHPVIMNGGSIELCELPKQ